MEPIKIEGSPKTPTVNFEASGKIEIKVVQYRKIQLSFINH